MQSKYPVLQETILYAINSKDPKLFFEMQLDLYQRFLSGVYSTQDPSEQVCGNYPNNPEREILQVDWVANYIEAVFSILFIQTDFLDYFYNPVMDLFIKYFFPVEMDYVNDLIKRIVIKDKWNSIATQEELSQFINCSRTSLQTPIRGLDHKNFQINMYKKHSYIEKIDSPNILAENFITDQVEIEEFNNVQAVVIRKSPVIFKERTRSLKFRGDEPPANTAQLTIRKTMTMKSCFKLTRTKDYQLANLFKKVDAYTNKSNKKEKNGPEKNP
jgi:hypothetical protein